MISFFTNINETSPKKDMTIDEIYDLISKNEQLSKVRLTALEILASSFEEEEQMSRLNQLKKGLPLVTFSGSFKQRRKDNILKHSEYIVIDIDGISSMEEVNKTKAKVNSNFNHVVLLFISPRQRGLKVVHRVEIDGSSSIEPQHQKAFEGLKNLYKIKLNIDIDKSGSDVSRACFLIGDPDAIYNSNPRKFIPENLEPENGISLTKEDSTFLEKNFELSKDVKSQIIEEIYRFLVRTDKSITESHHDWIRVGFALKNEFDDETGMELFHKLSKLDGKYNKEQCNVQFMQGKRGGRRQVRVGTILDLAKKKGFSPTKLEKEAKTKIEFQFVHSKIVEEGISLRYNTLSARVEYKIHSSNWELVDDRLLNKLYINVLYKRMPLKDLYAFLEAVAPDYNPVDEFIKSLPIQELKPEVDYIRLLSETIKSTDSSITYESLKVWIEGFIRCLKDDEFVNELIVVLIGGQGIGKTRWVRSIVPKEWKHLFVSKNLDPNHKDDMNLLSTNFWINMDELSTVLSKRTTSEAFKSMISTSVHSVRLPYDKFPKSLIRRSSILGTSNEVEYLKDLTGNRRFVSIELSSIDADHKVDIMKVYAQAYKSWLNSPKKCGIISDDLQQKFEKHNSEYRVTNSYEELIQRYFSPVNKKEGVEVYKLTTREIISIINSTEKDSQGIAQEAIRSGSESLIGKMLRNLGFGRPDQKRINGIQGKFYDVSPNTVINTSVFDVYRIDNKYFRWSKTSSFDDTLELVTNRDFWKRNPNWKDD